MAARPSHVYLVIRDNGPGLAPEGAASGGQAERGGIGLANTEERLRHLYGDSGKLALESPPEGGARVTLEFPFRAREREPREVAE